MTWNWLPFVSTAEPDTAAESAADDGPSIEIVATESDRSLDTSEAIHQSLVSPSELERTPTALRTGERWARTHWMGQSPDAPQDGLFEKLYSIADTRTTDISLHIKPGDTEATLDSLENQIEDLEAEMEYLSEKRRAGARGVSKDLQDYQELYDALRNTSMEAFDVSMYLTEHGETREDMTSDAVANAARRTPANLTPVTPRWAQLDVLASASQVGMDKLHLDQETQSPMLCGALGAMFPFVAGALAEHGIEWGTYALNESPLLLDRFARETATVRW